MSACDPLRKLMSPKSGRVTLQRAYVSKKPLLAQCEVAFGVGRQTLDDAVSEPNGGCVVERQPFSL